MSQNQIRRATLKQSRKDAKKLSIKLHKVQHRAEQILRQRRAHTQRHYNIGQDAGDVIEEKAEIGPRGCESLPDLDRIVNTLTGRKPTLKTAHWEPYGPDDEDPYRPKNANKYFRWNLLFTFVILLCITYPFWFTALPLLNRASLTVVIVATLLLHLVWLSATINAATVVYKLRRQIQKTRTAVGDSEKGRPDGTVTRIRSDERLKRVKHLVGIPIYKEPLELMELTLNSVARQPGARQKIAVVIAMEAATPDRKEKEAQLIGKYRSKFERFYITAHPKGVFGELPGKCSNWNYASRQAVRLLRKDRRYGLFQHRVELLVTTGDCDSVFPPRYFELLEQDYANLDESCRNEYVWQSPLFYCWNVDKAPFFVRITGILRSFVMIGLMIPWQVNTMSIFSLPLSLYEAGNYTHPGYQMDDIIAVIRWALFTRRQLKIRLLPVATLSGPTSGETFRAEVYEWARQVRRWMIGAAEVFHYFVIKSNRLPLQFSLRWGVTFFNYYGIMACVAPIFCITAPGLTLLMLQVYTSAAVDVLIPSVQVYNFILLGLLLLQYFWYLMMFWLYVLAQPAFPDQIRDSPGVCVQFLHWLLTLPVALCYACVALYAFLEASVRGKAVCTHDPSDKQALQVQMALSRTRSNSV